MNELIDYVELRAGDMQASKAFYAAAFGWGFADYGPEYAAFEGAGLDGGLDATTPAADRPPLVILKSEDLEDALGASKQPEASSPSRSSTSPAAAASTFATRRATSLASGGSDGDGRDRAAA